MTQALPRVVSTKRTAFVSIGKFDGSYPQRKQQFRPKLYRHTIAGGNRS
jgi:hypothetical protein